MKMCLECWEYQPIDRTCLYDKDNPKPVHPMREACIHFKSVSDDDEQNSEKVSS